MSDPQETANQLLESLGNILGVCAVIVLQAFALCSVLGWFGIPVQLTLWQAIVTCALIQTLIK